MQDWIIASSDAGCSSRAQIQALGQGGQPGRVLAVFDVMRSGRPLTPDGAPSPPPNERTWTVAIAACHANGCWRETLRLYRDMCSASEFEPDGYILQTVISACERAGAWEEADAVRQLAQICPDMDQADSSTHGCLPLNHCRSQNRS